MKYIIMSGGKGSRWNNYKGITKQEIRINNETLLERTCRFIKNNCNDEIIILTNNAKHVVENCKSIKPESSTYFKSKYGYEILNEEITYLYGDTLYTDEIIKEIINTKTNNILFFGNVTASIAVKAVDFNLFKSIIEEGNEEASLYSQVKKRLNLDNNSCFKDIGKNFYNINSPLDYENLEFFSSNIKDKFISVGISFDINSIEKLKERINIDSIKKIKINNIKDFYKKLFYHDLTKEERIKNISNINTNEVYTFTIEINSPTFDSIIDPYLDICEEVNIIKQDLSKNQLIGHVYISNNVIDSAKVRTLTDNSITLD